MPDFDNTQALQEGWGIFDCDGSENGPWQLQKCDDSNLLKDDFEAWMLVSDKAAAGSAYHQMTLLFLETHNPAEATWIKDAVRNRGAVQ